MNRMWKSSMWGPGQAAWGVLGMAVAGCMSPHGLVLPVPHQYVAHCSSPLADLQMTSPTAVLLSICCYMSSAAASVSCCSHRALLVHDLPAAAAAASSFQLLDPSDLAQHSQHRQAAPSTQLHPRQHSSTATAACVPAVLPSQSATAHATAMASCCVADMGGVAGGGAAVAALLPPTYHPAGVVGTCAVQLPQD